MNMWAWLWISWIVAFLVIEGAALIRKGARDTLSWHLWWWLGLWPSGEGQVKTYPTFGVWLRRMFLLCFTVWLVVHIFGNGWV